MNLWGNWLGERMTSQRSSWCKARNKCLIKPKKKRGHVHRGVGWTVIMRCVCANLKVWNTWCSYTPAPWHEIKFFSIQCWACLYPKSIVFWWFIMISIIYHLDQCWDDEMSILNLTKTHILGTCSSACNLQVELAKADTKSLISPTRRLQMPWQVDVCHVLARHANTRLDLRCAGSKNGALNIKTVPLTRINIKNTCLATHVN